MTNEAGSPTESTPVSTEITERLAELDEGQLRQTAEYIQDLLDSKYSVSSQIEAEEGEELVHVTEHDGYTAVVKQQPCTTGCEDCPHGPYLYHVRRETGPEGNESLHWSYIGPVR
ncbi:hypothetical protein [Halomarina litorea]|uniref:hypothetical protein n=1 Tax=Halomarina litorea TaxID=2961595 RepID=UPI0020C21A26|nr:hypothetical protein [Halomarina sp. BCD28]